jgi:predicted cupin superfamily sugar epimerase
MVTAKELIERLDLKPHPEGGYFAEVWRAPERLAVNALPLRYSGARSLSTSIYFLLTHDTFSRMHRLRSDEIFHFYLGEPVEMLLLGPRGAAEKKEEGAGEGAGKGAGGGAGENVGPGELAILGNDIKAGQRPQILVRRGTWQGARLVSRKKGAFALMGTTMAPGFEYEDYQEGDRAKLVGEYPEFAEKICDLTR